MTALNLRCPGWAAVYSISFFVIWSAGCASLHNQQLTDIDSSRGSLSPFEIQTSATGVSIRDGATVARALAPNQTSRDQVSWVETILALTQMGPQTGEPTFTDDWADGLVTQILKLCPSGQITGITTRREAMKYPVISGEIVTIKGFCVL